jgi:hypothetical protein
VAVIPLPLESTGVFKLGSWVVALMLPAVTPDKELLFHAAICAKPVFNSIEKNKKSNRYFSVNNFLIKCF